ncbi:TraI domain-containing protein [Xenorhabdus bovienii]|uniref:TraI domain-containing protein n=2 Tax=Xenorhabdus bovienii TaxID=40576 RepID=A0AAJ1JBC1_XENBV|nr:TraI domain-containing protein [Xenorhabdus bovienii]MDE1480605.1 TraI domain-containing protein [Xenorhabdus bovienii]MDE1488290.1 TraI domain-containing protein [Xenorhabdus bovienii]MDE1491938.1 TraI domain-containing protein [Xenorhabdus bovienii]MDE1496435.1 TraI domain-containing protein [Xenorhabdus bovienii]MDE9474409.1 TraI domain-containing protein [Xenorhabdus bovienii]
MFARFKSHFTRPPASQKKSSEQKTREVHDNGGYFRPQSADALLATPLRRQCLQQLWQNSALPEGLYQRFYLAPVKQLLGSVQQVPATPEGDWSGSGGFADLTLQFITCTVRLAKGHMLPPGAAPETQAAQGILWQAVVFWAALFYHLPLLRQFEGELENGHHWQPGVGIPDKPFRFRFRTPENIPTVPQEVLLAACLLPEKAMMWLVTVPEVWHCLMQHLNGRPSTVPLIDTLLQEAAGQVHSPLWVKPTVSLSPVTETAFSAGCNSVPETASPPPVSDITSPLPSPSDDTLALLSLFQSTDGASQQNKGKNHHHDLKLTKRPGREKESIATDSHRHSSFKDK